MYQRRAGSYDSIPEGMKQYINNYGCHFNKKLCEEAVSRMYTSEGRLKPFTKEKVDNLLSSNGVEVRRAKLYDTVYVANMGLNDFFGRSIPNEKCLALYIKDVLDDADAEEGYVFNRFYADTMFMDNPIEWDDMV